MPARLLRHFVPQLVPEDICLRSRKVFPHPSPPHLNLPWTRTDHMGEESCVNSRREGTALGLALYLDVISMVLIYIIRVRSVTK